MNRDCTLRTERMILREIVEGDAEQIVAWRSDPSVYQYFRNPHGLTIEEHLIWYKEKYLKEENSVSWIAFFQEGTGSSNRDDTKHNAAGVFQAVKNNEDIAEISYLLDKKYQGRGLASEAITAIEHWIKSEWNVDFAMAEIHKENTGSLQFIKRLGYVRENDFEIYSKEL